MKWMLELGCGRNPKLTSTSDAPVVFHDISRHSPFIDCAHDLDVIPWPWVDGHFDEIVAVDVFEHLKVDIEEWLSECWRILKPGGQLTLRVPEASSWHAMADPTHRRLFHWITFDYFDPESQWHKNYGKYYGFAAAGQWWHVQEKRKIETPTEFGLLTDLGFALMKET